MFTYNLSVCCSVCGHGIETSAIHAGEVYQYIKILLVCLCVCVSVCDGCGHDTPELQATRRNPFWTLAISLTTGKNIRLFGVLDQNKIFYLRVTACREQGSHCQDERLAWVASRGQWTSYSNSFVSKVLGANYNRAI